MLGMGTTVFASNPFSDVPAGHWAYNSIEKLAAEGIIEGYGDNTYRGNRNITRYEMAQMIARALARYENFEVSDDALDSRVDARLNEKLAAQNANANTRTSSRPVLSGANRAELDKLAYEFSEELNGLGVRVSELEKHADLVQWNGKIEMTFANARTDPDNSGHKDKDIWRGYTFYLDPEIKLNKNWTAMAEFQVEGNLTEDSTAHTELNNVWVEGEFGDNFAVALGRVPFYTNEEGLIFNADMSGAMMLFGDEFYVALAGGRMHKETFGGGLRGVNDGEDFKADILGVNVQYAPENEHGLYGGAGFYYLKDKDFMTENYSRDGATDKAYIWSVNASYSFTDKLALFGSFAQNTKADHEKNSWQAELEYGSYDGDYETEKGDWSVFAGYRQFGTNVSFTPSDDDVMRGMRGWFVGANYAPFKNVGLTARYFKGKYITGHGDAQKIFGEIDFFF